MILRLLWFLNPLRPWIESQERIARAAREAREWEILQRREEHDLQIRSIEALAGVVQEALKTSAAQTEIVHKFLESFQTSEPPQLREWDEEKWESRAIARKKEGLPPELNGLGSLEQYTALIDRLNTFGLDD